MLLSPLTPLDPNRRDYLDLHRSATKTNFDHDGQSMSATPERSVANRRDSLVLHRSAKKPVRDAEGQPVRAGSVSKPSLSKPLLLCGGAQRVLSHPAHSAESRLDHHVKAPTLSGGPSRMGLSSGPRRIATPSAKVVSATPLTLDSPAAHTPRALSTPKSALSTGPRRVPIELSGSEEAVGGTVDEPGLFDDLESGMGPDMFDATEMEGAMSPAGPQTPLLGLSSTPKKPLSTGPRRVPIELSGSEEAVGGTVDEPGLFDDLESGMGPDMFDATEKRGAMSPAGPQTPLLGLSSGARREPMDATEGASPAQRGRADTVVAAQTSELAEAQGSLICLQPV
jgi:hypothetical protein